MSTTATPLKTEAQPDANFLSLERGGQTWFAGTDRAVPAVAPEDGMELIPERPKDWESALKLSGRLFAGLRNLQVAQCKENALDVNWSHQCSLHGRWGIVGTSGEQVVTIKGGSSGITVAGPVYSTGTRADVVLGLWADQSQEVTRDIELQDLSHVSGRPLTVILCRVNQPWRAWLLGQAPTDIRLPKDARVLRLKSLGAQLHWAAKFAGVKLGLIKGRSA